jgi:hypothetical protein
MAHTFTVERYEGEQAVIERCGSIIVSTYLCGDLSRIEAKEMARAMADQHRQQVINQNWRGERWRTRQCGGSTW